MKSRAYSGGGGGGGEILPRNHATDRVDCLECRNTTAGKTRISKPHGVADAREQKLEFSSPARPPMSDVARVTLLRFETG